ncbi:MAG TPA: hypothetical protein VMS29_06775 [Pyrinomonadaceae bacterium]|nr:hypothetical protein [Pyrinomonadaceae bacterium]
MITGFNTDVEYDGVTYHVQTEDKGLETPVILTLVYDHGTILASKRQGYEDLFEGGFDEKALVTKLKRQHSLICAAIRKGQIGKLIEQTNRESQKAAAAGKNSKRRAAPLPIPAEDDDASPIPKPEMVSLPEPLPVVEVVSIVEEEPVLLPIEAVEVVSDMAGRDRPVHNKLCLEFINETSFRGGERKAVTLMVSRGSDRRVVNNAQILVKIIGTHFRPKIFHSTTDQNGLANLELEMPDFVGGRAAFLVRASNGGEEIELRRVILQS